MLELIDDASVSFFEYDCSVSEVSLGRKKMKKAFDGSRSSCAEEHEMM